MKLEKRFRKYIPLLREEKRYISTYPENFVEKTQNYVRRILEAAGLVDGKYIIMLDQPFPPNDPSVVFHYYDDPYAIIVNRDPRDLYVLVKHLRFSKARFIPHDTVENFVKYYRAVSYYNQNEDKSRILRIQFEDLIYEYDATVKRIEEFLHIDKHISPRKYLDPQISIKNTYMMDLFPEDKEDIAYIEKELPEYLFPFEKYEKPDNRDGIYGALSANKYKK